MKCVKLYVQSSIVSDIESEDVLKMSCTARLIMKVSNLNAMFPRNNNFFLKVDNIKDSIVFNKLKKKTMNLPVLNILQDPHLVDYQMYFSSKIKEVLKEYVKDFKILQVNYNVSYIEQITIDNKLYEAIPSKSLIIFVIDTKEKINKINKEVYFGKFNELGYGKCKLLFNLA